MQWLRTLLQPLIVPVRKQLQRSERNRLRRKGEEITVYPSVRRKKLALGAGDGEWTIAKCTPKIVYSFGVGKDIRFETDLLRRFDCNVYCFDPTPKSKQWICDQQLPEGLTFYPWGIADFDGTASFALPEGHNVSYVMSESGDTGTVKRLTTIMQELGHDHIDVLKIDIEGAEYSVLEDIAASNLSIGQILVEFHHRYSSATLEQTRSAIALLESQGYALFDVSARGLEYGFVSTG